MLTNKKLLLAPVLCVPLLWAGYAGADAEVSILSPKDGATLKANAENQVEYKFAKTGRTDHLHIWVNGDKGPALRSVNGAYTLPQMSPGKYAIIAKAVDKGHVPTGPEKSIFVTVE